MQQVAPYEAGSVIKGLFDFTFSRFIATKVIRIAYGLLVVLASLFAVVTLIAGANQGGGAFAATLVIVPIGFVLYLIWARVLLEFMIVVFRIGEDVRAMHAMQYQSMYPAPPSAQYPPPYPPSQPYPGQYPAAPPPQYPAAPQYPPPPPM